jgi:hypothetical protein
MSMATLERVILASSKVVFNNSKLRLKDIQEWSSGEIEAHDGEVSVYVPDPGVYVAVKIECDKRKAK